MWLLVHIILAILVELISGFSVESCFVALCHALFSFRDFSVSQLNLNFNFLHCLGLIDLFSANDHAEISACI